MISASRARLRPKALSTFAVSSSSRPVKFRYTPPVPKRETSSNVARTHALARLVCSASGHMPSIEIMYGDVRSANAVASGSTSAMAPPMWNVLSRVSGAGRSWARAASTSMSGSDSSSTYCDFQ